MSQLSRYPIRKDVEERIFEIFKTTISRLKDAADIEDFLEDFLSPVEKIMLAKRLSIALLLEKGYSYEAISKILRVTSTTIAKTSMSLKYSGKGYKKMVQILLRDERTSEFREKIEDLFASIPGSKGSSIVKQKIIRKEREMRNKKPF